MKAFFTIIGFLTHLFVAAEMADNYNCFFDLWDRCRILYLHQISLRFSIDQIEPVVHGLMVAVLSFLFQFKEMDGELVCQHLMT